MDAEIAAGQLWVKAKLRELAEGRVATIQAFEWQAPRTRNAEQFVAGSLGLAIWIGEERRVVQFLERELEDVVASLEVQADLIGRLKEALR